MTAWWTSRRPIIAWSISLLLAVVTLIAFGGAIGNGFVDYDDRGYIVNNPHVQPGLTTQSVLWALSTTQEAHWHPLTWLSLELDVDLYQQSPAGFHLTNLLLHSASALLLFAALRGLLGSVWLSAWIAALFAWHPLRVESVCWAAERKDVLCTFFGMLALLSYVDSVRWRGAWRYVRTLCLFGLGLTAKPMIVTLPIVFLLLDYWPLERLRRSAASRKALEAQGLRVPADSWLQVIWEKLPFVGLMAASAVVAWYAQHRSGVTNVPPPLGLRVENAIVSYVRYLEKVIWPVRLAPYYPFPRELLPPWHVMGAGGLLLILTFVTLRSGRRRPYLLVGWFWYLCMLAPVIGFTPVLGGHARADRYTYLPLVGIFLAVGCLLREVMDRRPRMTPVVTTAAVCVLVLCVLATRLQVSFWRNSITLWQHTLAVVGEDSFVEDNLGVSLIFIGKPAEAVPHFQKAIRIDPQNPAGYANLGQTLAQQGQLPKAESILRTALRLKPDLAETRNALGRVLTQLGQLREGEQELRTALRLREHDANAHNNLAVNLKKQGKVDEALYEYSEALRLEPRHVEALTNLAILYLELGQFREAEAQFRRVLQLDPNDGGIWNGLGTAVMLQERASEAVGYFHRAVQVSPREPLYRSNLAHALLGTHHEQEAMSQYQQALALDVAWPQKAAQTAWMLATHPQPSRRQGRLALQLAQEACEATGKQDRLALEALEAAYAEVGQFPDAERTNRQVAKAAAAAHDGEAVRRAHERGELYRRREPVRDSAPGP